MIYWLVCNCACAEHERIEKLTWFAMHSSLFECTLTILGRYWHAKHTAADIISSRAINFEYRFQDIQMTAMQFDPPEHIHIVVVCRKRRQSYELYEKRVVEFR